MIGEPPGEAVGDINRARSCARVRAHALVGRTGEPRAAGAERPPSEAESDPRTFKHTGAVRSLALLPDGLRFVFGSQCALDRTARIVYHGLAK